VTPRAAPGFSVPDPGHRVATLYRIVVSDSTVVVGGNGIVTYSDASPTPTSVLDPSVRKALS
jgi:hypothetical protein